MQPREEIALDAIIFGCERAFTMKPEGGSKVSILYFLSKEKNKMALEVLEEGQL